MSDHGVQYAIGVDLGGTKIELGVVDDSGKVLQKIRLETQVAGGARAVKAQMIDGILGLQKTFDGAILGIGIGVAGQIDPLTERVIFAPNLKWHDLPLREDLEKALHLPVRLLNDVRAITWGEWLYGAGRGCDDWLCVFVGTGIGAGVVSGGRLLAGCSNTCGEVGHMTIDFKGPLCTCGNRGCVEAYAGGWGIAERAKEALSADGGAHSDSLLMKMVDGAVQTVTAKLVIQAYRAGDPLAREVIDLAATALSAGCTSLINAFNPRRFVLGGGLIDGFPELIEWVDRGVRKSALKAAIAPLTIAQAELGKEVGVIGSAAVIFNEHKT